ncbi:MAG: gliding motility-associated C-terminal domain-containing protein, partial [Bacteroidia bacterium]|nr:gliding motility-associated C-terminal domain-containing protein [Bacteroidia bacterium]
GSGANPSGLTAGNYTLTLTDANGCTISQTTSITSNTVSPNVNAGVDDTLDCGPAASLNLSGSSSTGGVIYSWSGPGGFTSSQSNPTINSAGNYTLTVTNSANGCSSTDVVAVSQTSINVSFIASPSSGAAPLSVGFTNTSTNTTNYIWDFGNGTGSLNVNDSSIYTVTGTYTVTLIGANQSGCTDTATQIITVFENSFIILPNVFSPNGDGINDIFFFTCQGITELNCNIYNRWGQLMYQILDPTGKWDGKETNSSQAADGTYFYILKAKGADGKEYNIEGFILLTR